MKIEKRMHVTKDTLLRIVYQTQAINLPWSICIPNLQSLVSPLQRKDCLCLIFCNGYQQLY